jgi:STE24 endopeptidase
MPAIIPPPSVWRPTLADPLDFFTADEVDCARAYQRPLRWMRRVRFALSLTVVVAFLLAGVGRSIVDAAAMTPWPVQLALVFVALEALLFVIDVPIDVWVDFVYDRRWELSTQTPATFVADQAKSFVLSTVFGLALLVPVYALIRTTSWWWLVGWLLATTLGILLGFLFPVVIAPVFNRFEALRDEALATRLATVAAAAHVPIAGVLVADESRRSRRDNAYVSGLGATRRVVLFDTILEHPPELIEQVVAHELGHWRRHHLRQQIPVLAATTLIVFVVLRLLASWQRLFTWLDLEGLGDPASLPLLLLGGQLGLLLTGLVTAWLSRAHEREADLDALELLARPDDMVEMLRRLHVKNLADLDPGPLQRIRASHPAAAERMAFARAWQDSAGSDRARDPFTLM